MNHTHLDLICVISFTFTALLPVLGCDHSLPKPKSMLSQIERFDADVVEYRAMVAESENTVETPLVRVIAEDTGMPVPGVFVGLTLIGPDGGDGGFQRFLTDSNGIAKGWHTMIPGRYQHHVRPRPNSGYQHTEWRRDEPYVIIREDGTTELPDLTVHIDR